MERRTHIGGRFSRMLIPTIIMATLAVGLTIFTYTRGGDGYIVGLKSAGNLLIQVLPLIVCAFIVAGMVQVLIPTKLVAEWIGPESGFRGLLIGMGAGMLTPGGPPVILPIAAGLMKAGAGIGTLLTYVTAWSLVQLAALPLQIGIMGWKFVLVRIACVFIFPLIAGLIGNRLFSGVDLS
jgi:uncharacterized membrane protein YraQ (UPF0718 family)